jgi:hypothetical protein
MEHGREDSFLVSKQEASNDAARSGRGELEGRSPSNKYEESAD